VCFRWWQQHVLLGRQCHVILGGDGVLGVFTDARVFPGGGVIRGCAVFTTGVLVVILGRRVLQRGGVLVQR